jgi:hypothetical protein
MAMAHVTDGTSEVDLGDQRALVLRKLLSSYSQAQLTSNFTGKWLAKHVRPQFEPIPEPNVMMARTKTDLVDLSGRSGQSGVGTAANALAMWRLTARVCPGRLNLRIFRD